MICSRRVFDFPKRFYVATQTRRRLPSSRSQSPRSKNSLPRLSSSISWRLTHKFFNLKKLKKKRRISLRLNFQLLCMKIRWAMITLLEHLLRTRRNRRGLQNQTCLNSKTRAPSFRQKEKRSNWKSWRALTSSIRLEGASVECTLRQCPLHSTPSPPRTSIRPECAKFCRSIFFWPQEKLIRIRCVTR